VRHEVTSGRLYVGNLSYDTSESDLLELFSGVGQVQTAEVVYHRHNQRSKGYAFVEMTSLEEARRAVEVLNDKEFMGRKILVSGARTTAPYSDEGRGSRSAGAQADSASDPPTDEETSEARAQV
jgi:RNA recognition motif-containing protein